AGTLRVTPRLDRYVNASVRSVDIPLDGDQTRRARARAEGETPPKRNGAAPQAAGGRPLGIRRRTDRSSDPSERLAQLQWGRRLRVHARGTFGHDRAPILRDRRCQRCRKWALHYHRRDGWPREPSRGWDLPVLERRFEWVIFR